MSLFTEATSYYSKTLNRTPGLTKDIARENLMKAETVL